MDVRRLAELIVLCCALGGCARAAAPASIVPPPAASAVTDGGILVSDNAPAAPSRPRLRVEKPIGVTAMRVVKDDSSEGYVPAAKCEVQILRENPAGKAREVATLNVDGAPAQHQDILSLLKREACEAGANAIVIKNMRKTHVQGVKMDHVDAIALVVGIPEHPSIRRPSPRPSRSRLRVPLCPRPSRLIRARRPS
jgi:hypothetical protein